jgi:lipopolysaccharide biosynthesis regulator YciM
LISYLSYVEKNNSSHKAKEFMLGALKRRPTIRGFKHFVKMQMQSTDDRINDTGLDLIKELIAEYIKVKHRYNCRICGFNSSKHYWSCPSCHEWEQLKPLRGLEGE